MSNYSPEVLQLLTALAPKVQSCKEELSAQNTANTLYSPQNMSSARPEVPPQLMAVVRKVQSCEEVLNAITLRMDFRP